MSRWGSARVGVVRHELKFPRDIGYVEMGIPSCLVLNMEMREVTFFYNRT
jgi:hypothetical protein